MRRLLAVALVAMVVGCSSEAEPEPEVRALPVDVVAQGRGVTWAEVGEGVCDVGDVRVSVEMDGTAVFVGTLPFAGEVDETGQQCVAAGEVEVPGGIVTVTVSGEGPVGADWSASAQLAADEGVSVTARWPAPAEASPAA